MTETEFEYSSEERLKGLIDMIDDYINHYHGGSVRMVNFDGKTLRVQLGGACEKCPLSMTTLNGYVAGTVRQFFPEIEHIEAVE